MTLRVNMPRPDRGPEATDNSVRLIKISATCCNNLSLMKYETYAWNLPELPQSGNKIACNVSGTNGV